MFFNLEGVFFNLRGVFFNLRGVYSQNISEMYNHIITCNEFNTRIKEHSSQNTSEVYKHNHIITCNEFNYIKNILQITPYDDTSINCSLTDLIFTNTKIIDKSRHWSLLLYLESI